MLCAVLILMVIKAQVKNMGPEQRKVSQKQFLAIENWVRWSYGTAFTVLICMMVRSKLAEIDAGVVPAETYCPGEALF